MSKINNSIVKITLRRYFHKIILREAFAIFEKVCIYPILGNFYFETVKIYPENSQSRNFFPKMNFK